MLTEHYTIQKRHYADTVWYAVLNEHMTTLMEYETYEQAEREITRHLAKSWYNS